MEWFTQTISATAVAVGVHTVANRAVSATIIMAASLNMHQKQATMERGAYESDGGRLVSSITVQSDFGR